ncbi:Lsr2 family DNA-binding protein [Actinokineospora globicatena]
MSEEELGAVDDNAAEQAVEPDHFALIREWARANGHEVTERGTRKPPE